MTFTRTNLGLSNLYLFFKVDAVVFVEGGQSISRDDVEKGNYTSSSSDIRFWQALFNIYRPKETYQFRAIGSKENVKSIATKRPPAKSRWVLRRAQRTESPPISAPGALKPFHSTIVPAPSRAQSIVAESYPPKRRGF